jgi:hypothetical protein
VLNLACQGTVVAVAHLLVGSARVQLGLRQYRLVVIETATAVELAITDFLSTHYASLPHAQIILNDRPTLGALTKNIAAIPGLPPTVADAYGDFLPITNPTFSTPEMLSCTGITLRPSRAKHLTLMVRFPYLSRPFLQESVEGGASGGNLVLAGTVLGRRGLACLGLGLNLGEEFVDADL